MASGIEVLGLTLAILPLIVNQLDGYVRGIEKVRLLRRYKRELVAYSRGLATQRTLLINTLEQALDGIVTDGDELSSLICNPLEGQQRWNDPILQDHLRRRLDLNYNVFVDNVTGLSELLERLSKKLGININDASASHKPTWDIRQFARIMNRAVFDDLLAKIDGANTTLATLLDHSVRREAATRKSWPRLLSNCKRRRVYAESLFKTINGSRVACQCSEKHYVYLQLPIDPHQYQDIAESEVQYQLQLNFSNNRSMNLYPHLNWTNVLFGSQQAKEPIHDDKLAINNTLNGGPNARKLKVRFDIPLVEANQAPPREQNEPFLSPIDNFCSSIGMDHVKKDQWENKGSIPNILEPTTEFTMHAVKKTPIPAPSKHLRQSISELSRYDRLRIAASLACCVIQISGNWLSSWWDSTNILLAPDGDDCSILPNNVYLSWPLVLSESHPGKNNILLPLGCALMELSLAKPLGSIIALRNENLDQDNITNMVLPLISKVYLESGTQYGDVVESCLSRTTTNPMGQKEMVNERVFDRIIAPFLNDLISFEGGHKIR